MNRMFLGCWCLLLLTACDAPIANSNSGDSPAATGPSIGGAQPQDDGKPPVKQDFASVAEAFEVLTSATDAGEKPQQMAAYNWLCRQDERAVPEVAAAMNDSSVPMEVRRLACAVLSKLGPAAVPALVKASRSEEKMLQLKAIETMPSLKPPPEQVISRLMELIHDPDESVQIAAIRSLGSIGQPAKASAETLIAMQNNPSLPETVRDAAAAAVRKVQPRRTFND